MTLEQQKLVQILRQATSPNSAHRQQANMHLQALLQQPGFTLFHQLIRLLAYPDFDVHVLAYSFLLNHIVYKTKRASEIMLQPVKQIFEVLEQYKIRQVRPQVGQFEKRQKNVVDLLVLSLSRSESLKARDQLLFHCLKVFSATLTNGTQRQFYRQIISGLVQQLSLQERMRSARITPQLIRLISDLWSQNNVGSYQIAINISYFLNIFPGSLFEKIMILLNQPNIPHQLFTQIVKRLASAMAAQSYKPKYEICFALYSRIKVYALMVKLDDIQPEDLIPLLLILKAGLEYLLQYEPTEMEQIYIIDNLLSLPEYHSMVQWLLSVSMVEEYEDDNLKEISRLIRIIIQLYSERMPEEQLSEYYTELVKSLNPNDEQKIVTFLCGAPLVVMQIFNVDLILQNIFKKCLQSAQPITQLSYLLFIEKYVQNSGYIDGNVLFSIEKIIIYNINHAESKLLQCKDKEEESSLIARLSVLFSIEMDLAIQPKNQSLIYINQRHYIQVVTEHVFKYIVNAYFGLSDLANERLHQGLIKLIRIRNQTYNSVILGKTAQLYISQFISLQKIVERKRVVKTKQQMLQIILESLSQKTDFCDSGLLSNLKLILFEFDGEDSILRKEMMHIYGQFMQIYNQKLAKESPVVREAQLYRQKDFINFNIGTAIEEVLFSEKPYEFMECISSNLEYDYAQNVEQMLNEYVVALMLLNEMSIHESCFGFVTSIALKFIVYLRQNGAVFTQLLEKLQYKRLLVKIQMFKLKRLPIYLDCLLETLYLNPTWRRWAVETSHQNDCQQLWKMSEFAKCKDRIDLFVSGDISKLLEQMSLEGQQKKKLERWDQAYADILEGSGVGELCNEWINQMKEERYL